MQYLSSEKKLATSPISRLDAIKEGLLDYADPYTKKNYFFVPNVYYIDMESWLMTKDKNENKMRNKIQINFKKVTKNFIGDFMIDNNNIDADVENAESNIEENIDGTAMELLDFDVEMNNMGV